MSRDATKLAMVAPERCTECSNLLAACSCRSEESLPCEEDDLEDYDEFYSLCRSSSCSHHHRGGTPKSETAEAVSELQLPLFR